MKGKISAAKKVRPKPAGGPTLVPVSEEMRHLSAILEQELVGWPDVATRSMFGVVAIYRRKTIFAALPRTRAVTNASAISLRFDPLPDDLARRAESEPALQPESGFSNGRWFTFTLESTDSLREALWWLNQAYERATAAAPRRRPRKAAGRARPFRPNKPDGKKSR